MNNQEKFTTRSSKLKVRRANSQALSLDPARFSSDILFSTLVSFAFYVLVFFLFFFFKLKIYILIHIRLCGWVSDKKNFTRPISGNKTTFFWPDVEIDKIEKFLNAYFMFSVNGFHMYTHSDLKLLLPNFIVFRK